LLAINLHIIHNKTLSMILYKLNFFTMSCKNWLWP